MLQCARLFLCCVAPGSDRPRLRGRRLAADIRQRGHGARQPYPPSPSILVYGISISSAWKRFRQTERIHREPERDVATARARTGLAKRPVEATD